MVDQAGLILYPETPVRNNLPSPDGWVFNPEKMRGEKVK
jgi:hypothetical protein